MCARIDGLGVEKGLGLIKTNKDGTIHSKLQEPNQIKAKIECDSHKNMREQITSKNFQFSSRERAVAEATLLECMV